MGAGDTAARDFKLDPATGDLAMEGGDLVFVVGGDSIASDLKARLQQFRGEWFLDHSDGVPMFESVLVKRPNIPALRAIFRDAIEAAPGVAELTELGFDYDNSARRLTITFRVTTDTGELLPAQSVEVTV